MFGREPFAAQIEWNLAVVVFEESIGDVPLANGELQMSSAQLVSGWGCGGSGRLFDPSG